MHRLPILIVVALCFHCGLLAPALATDYCPPVPVGAGQSCNCFVWNYAALLDTNVTMELSWWDSGSGNGTEIWGPDYLTAKGGSLISHVFTGIGYCGCKVAGEGFITRTSLFVRSGDGTLLAVVPCGAP